MLPTIRFEELLLFDFAIAISLSPGFWVFFDRRLLVQQSPVGAMSIRVNGEGAYVDKALQAWVCHRGVEKVAGGGDRMKDSLGESLSSCAGRQMEDDRSVFGRPGTIGTIQKIPPDDLGLARDAAVKRNG